MSDERDTIGYIGLGNMGGALAARLMETYRLFVHDRDASAVARLVDRGAEASGDLANLAKSCRTILLCLPTSEHVHAAVLGEDGLANALRPGSVVIDQTTGDPSATRDIASVLARRQVEFVDAPVSGGVQGAAMGTITMMVGGSDQQFAGVLAILQAISPNVFHAGPVGAGHTMKLVNNMVSGAQRLLTLEGVALAAKNGIAPATAVQIMSSGGARNAYLDQAMPARILRGDLDAGFTLRLAHKDVRLACQVGVNSDVPMFFGNLTREMYSMCISHFGADAPVDFAALLMDQLAHTHVVPSTAAATG